MDPLCQILLSGSFCSQKTETVVFQKSSNQVRNARFDHRCSGFRGIFSSMSLLFSLCICFASIVTSNFGPSNSTWALLGFVLCEDAKHLIQLVDCRWSCERNDFLLIFLDLCVAWPDFRFISVKVQVFCRTNSSAWESETNHQPSVVPWRPYCAWRLWCLAPS